MTNPARVLVSGTGLIGTSIALALREKGTEVYLSDADPATAKLAADLGAGVVVPDLRDAKGIAEIAVLAMPPALVGRELAFVQECAVADVYTDVASVKVLPARQARDLGCDLESYVPAHPLAGRERHGPAAAQADLFLGRTWALCPLPETAPGALDAVTGLPPRPGHARQLGRARLARAAPRRRRDGRQARTVRRSRRRAQASGPGPQGRDQDRGGRQRAVDADPHRQRRPGRGSRRRRRRGPGGRRAPARRPARGDIGRRDA